MHCLYVTIAFENGTQFPVGNTEWQIFDNNHIFVIYNWCRVLCRSVRDARQKLLAGIHQLAGLRLPDGLLNLVESKLGTAS